MPHTTSVKTFGPNEHVELYLTDSWRLKISLVWQVYLAWWF